MAATNGDPHTSILDLEAELHKQAENCEKMSLSIKQSEFDLKKKDEEIIQHQHKVMTTLIAILLLLLRFTS